MTGSASEIDFLIAICTDDPIEPWPDPVPDDPDYEPEAFRLAEVKRTLNKTKEEQENMIEDRIDKRRIVTDEHGQKWELHDPPNPHPRSPLGDRARSSIRPVEESTSDFEEDHARFEPRIPSPPPKPQSVTTVPPPPPKPQVSHVPPPPPKPAPAPASVGAVSVLLEPPRVKAKTAPVKAEPERAKVVDPEPEIVAEEPVEEPVRVVDGGKHAFTVKGGVLKEFIKPLLSKAGKTAMFEATRVAWSREGWFTRAVDPAHVAMIDVCLPPSACESFSANGNIEIGVDWSKVKDFLKIVKKNDLVTVEYDAEEHKLAWKLGNVTRRMTVLDADGMEAPKPPKLDLACAFTIDTRTLDGILKNAASVSDHMKLIADADGVAVEAMGDDDTAELRIDRSELAEHRAPVRGASLFSLDYLHAFVKAVKTWRTLHFRLDTDMPVIVNAENENVTVTFMVAPRIERGS